MPQEELRRKRIAKFAKCSANETGVLNDGVAPLSNGCDKREVDEDGGAPQSDVAVVPLSNGCDKRDEDGGAPQSDLAVVPLLNEKPVMEVVVPNNAFSPNQNISFNFNFSE